MIKFEHVYFINFKIIFNFQGIIFTNKSIILNNEKKIENIIIMTYIKNEDDVIFVKYRPLFSCEKSIFSFWNVFQLSAIRSENQVKFLNASPLRIVLSIFFYIFSSDPSACYVARLYVLFLPKEKPWKKFSARKKNGIDVERWERGKTALFRTWNIFFPPYKRALYILFL